MFDDKKYMCDVFYDHNEKKVKCIFKIQILAIVLS